jgi:malonyl-CoA O-methyltransferase
MIENAFDRRRLRRAFDRAAPGFDSVAMLHREIAGRMLDRLSIIRLNATTILDAGSGTGFATNLLRKRFARSLVIDLDQSESMLRQLRNRRRSFMAWLRLPRSTVCADFQRMPLASASVDLIWSNLALHWAEEIPAVFAEAYRVLRPGGLLMFSMFGPDTLKELDRTAGDEGFRVNRFVDMHDVGDMLVHSAYGDPVMDMEYMTLTYTDVAALLRDLKAQGSICTQGLARKGLGARSAYASVVEGYEQLRGADGRLPATFEVIYGHAWKPAQRVSPTGRPVIGIRAT